MFKKASRATRSLFIGLLVTSAVALATAVSAWASHPYTCFFQNSSCGMGNMTPNAQSCGQGNVAGMFMHNQSVARPKTIWLSFPCVGDVVNGQKWNTSTEQIFTRHTNTTYSSAHHANCRNLDIYTVTVNCGRLH